MSRFSRSPLHSVEQPKPIEARRLVYGEVCGAGIYHLEGHRSEEVVGRWLSTARLSRMPPPGHSEEGNGGVLLAIGRDVWLFIGDTLPTDARAFHLVLDLSDAWTRLFVDGENAVELMAKGCALDLHPRSFPAGACAAAAFAQMRTVIWRPSERPRFELFVARSYAVSLWEWLGDAAAEYRSAQGGSRQPTHALVQQ